MQIPVREIELQREVERLDENLLRVERERDQLERELAAARIDLEKLREALRETLDLAAVANDGDPWYAEHEGLDSEAILKRAREALAVPPPEEPARYPGGLKSRIVKTAEGFAVEELPEEPH